MVQRSAIGRFERTHMKLQGMSTQMRSFTKDGKGQTMDANVMHQNELDDVVSTMKIPTCNLMRLGPLDLPEWPNKVKKPLVFHYHGREAGEK
jgi:hypothetical protein